MQINISHSNATAGLARKIIIWARKGKLGTGC